MTNTIILAPSAPKTSLVFAALVALLGAACSESTDTDGVGGQGGDTASTGGSNAGTGGEHAGHGGEHAGHGGEGPTCDKPTFDTGSFDFEGSYNDDFMTSFVITASAIETSSTFGDATFEATGFINEAGIMIAQNGADNDFNPGLWSQFTFIVDGSDTYMCQTPYGAENENAAICAEAPDAANLESGCDGFAWSKLTKK